MSLVMAIPVHIGPKLAGFQGKEKNGAGGEGWILKDRRQDDEDFGGKRGKQKANKKGKSGPAERYGTVGLVGDDERPIWEII